MPDTFLGSESSVKEDRITALMNLNFSAENIFTCIMDVWTNKMSSDSNKYQDDETWSRDNDGEEPEMAPVWGVTFMFRSDYKEQEAPAFGGGQEEHSWKKEHLVQIPRWEKAW